ncbi:hypothetical protein KFE25_006771 [Diacronema lutheri]|uniref:Uncharacterized protein n=1 Tax=Diacronema lutheri TaxID=2081491 RepID=A0A8J5XW96_DIALT|nr:hypothetical protein KFE25_006771 [Diacronema lutheri]
MNVSQLIGLSFLAVCSIFLHIFACAIYDNWWPMLVLLGYMCVPVPIFMFAILKGGSTDRSGLHWTEFATSFFFTNVLGIPFLLHHGEMIETGSLVLSLLGTFFAVVCAGLQAYLSGSALDIYNLLMGEQ